MALSKGDCNKHGLLVPRQQVPLHLALFFLNHAGGLEGGLWSCHCAILFAFLNFKLLVQLIGPRYVAPTSAVLVNTREGLEHPSSSMQPYCKGGCWREASPESTSSHQRYPAEKLFFQKDHPPHIHGCVELMQLLAHNYASSQMLFSCLLIAT